MGERPVYVLFYPEGSVTLEAGSSSSLDSGPVMRLSRRDLGPLDLGPSARFAGGMLAADLARAYLAQNLAPQVIGELADLTPEGEALARAFLARVETVH